MEVNPFLALSLEELFAHLEDKRKAYSTMTPVIRNYDSGDDKHNLDRTSIENKLSVMLPAQEHRQYPR